jgi:LacI family transcriptional regulator
MDVCRASTIKDVAALAKLSICTVSRALADKDRIRPETKDRVLRAARELKYKPNFTAQRLKLGRTNTLGLLLPDITNPYYPKIAKSIEAYAARHGYMILLCNADEDLQKEIQLAEMLLSRNVDGLIVLPATQSIRHIQRFADKGIPYVIINRSFDGEKHCIPSDNRYGAYTMVKYLIENNHTNICAVFPGFGNPIYRERYEGAAEALREFGLEKCAGSFLLDVRDMQNIHDRALAVLRKKNHPTAFFAANDFLATGIYSAVNECNLRIPNDISVAGYDDISFAPMMLPPLTTYLQPEDEMARAALDHLINEMENRASAPLEKLKGHIVIRGSVAPAVSGGAS